MECRSGSGPRQEGGPQSERDASHAWWLPRPEAIGWSDQLIYGPARQGVPRAAAWAGAASGGHPEPFDKEPMDEP
ncbi:hypothetical protein SY2F82_57790 [Streptomyces sp. Y2F8-2]|nr:hypothetical protein SY2F82_57790 [Streptomyces sp. Y2F8-2]